MVLIYLDALFLSTRRICQHSSFALGKFDAELFCNYNLHMSTDREATAARLDLIAAKAKVLANDYRQNRLWEGDLSKGLAELEAQIEWVQRESRDNQYYGR
jgi:hypothetical protein